MASGGGISGVAVALAAAGGVLIYAGFQGQNPIEALKDISSGKTRALEPTPVSFVNDPTSLGQGGGLAYGGGGGVVPAVWTSGDDSSFGAQLVAAALNHRHEKYSRPRRWQNGYSDCASFVGKSLKDIGITPPGASVTGSYLVWSKLKTIPRGAIRTGDILCSPGHVAIAIDATQAIGQQNGRHNVKIDSIENIMWGQPSWAPRRYIGEPPKSTGRTAQA
jgi:cell wall-associated NlpC family hydrolase